MLFRKGITRSCSYCRFGTQLDDDHILCMKHGVVPASKKCRKFSYDPCKRVPARPKAPSFEQYSEDDFKL